MTRDHLIALVALAAVATVVPIGWAVAQDRTLTAVVVVGVIIALCLAAHGLSGAAGVALHDRRQDRAAPMVYRQGGQIAGPLDVQRAIKMAADTAAAERQAALDGWTGGQYDIVTYQDRLTAEKEEAEPW